MVIQLRTPKSFTGLLIGVLLISLFAVVTLIGFAARAQSEAATGKFSVPTLTAPVMDQADLVDPAVESALNNALRQLRDSGGSQINVLTVPTLNGVPIEQASIQVTDQWKLGSSKGDNGALLMLSVEDRKMRIEVGQGLEGVIPDAVANRIIQERIAPLMKAGRTSEAILIGVASIVENSDPQFDFASRLNVPRQTRGAGRREGGSPWIWLLLLFIFFFMRPRRRRSRMGLLGFPLGYGLGRSHSGWGGGGGFGGLGGGGGGWGGGGGGFSGGGASGGW